MARPHAKFTSVDAGILRPLGNAMIILNVMLGRGRGGLERAAAHYHHALLASSHHVIGFGHAMGWMRGQLPTGAAFQGASPLNDFDFRTHFAMIRAVRDLRPTAVLAHGNRAIRFVSRLQGVPRIAVLHNSRFKNATGRLDAGIAVTPELATAAQRRYAGMNVEVVPNLVDMVPETTRPPRRNPIVIGALGRLHVDKGFDRLIRALADPGLPGTDWRLVIAGEGPERASLQMLATHLGIGKRVQLIGWADDRRSFFRSIDILCMPSRTESFGMVLIEAMAHGVPVIVSDNAGSREIVRGDRDALVVDANDRRALASALARLIADPVLAAALGRNGWERASTTYALPIVAERLDQALSRLVTTTLSKLQSSTDEFALASAAS
jgi:glycosyltransferase involved in cell wall biosynthesis